jgi:transposase
LPAKPRREARAARPSGRKALPEHLEIEAHRVRPDRCAQCGGTALDVVDEVVEAKLHVVKEHQRRRVVTRTTCRCRTCRARTTPPSLPAPYARSKVTCEWLAWFVHQKFGLLTPLDRVRRDLAARGIPLAMGTLVTFVARAADLLAPIDGLHWTQLLAGSWMATDGTGLKVLVPKLPAAHDGYVELYRNAACAVFQYAADKGGDAVVAKLRRFRGTLTADAEHRFNGVYATGRVRESGCNAHGRRKFRDAEATQPVLAAEGGAFVAAMYVAEADAHATRLVGDALLAHRRARIRPIAEQFDRWRAAVGPGFDSSGRVKVRVT